MVESKGQFRRRRGVSFRPFGTRPDAQWVNDGGEDAPMGPRDQRLFKGICFGAAFVIVVLILLVVLS